MVGDHQKLAQSSKNKNTQRKYKRVILITLSQTYFHLVEGTVSNTWVPPTKLVHQYRLRATQTVVSTLNRTFIDKYQPSQLVKLTGQLLLTLTPSVHATQNTPRKKALEAHCLNRGFQYKCNTQVRIISKGEA